MAKFSGKIGFVETVDRGDDVWEPVVTKRQYYGDILRSNYRHEQSSDSTNDNFAISNTISIVADKFAYENFHAMKFVEYMGVAWKINSAEILRPRINLTIGGVWNGSSEG